MRRFRTRREQQRERRRADAYRHGHIGFEKQQQAYDAGNRKKQQCARKSARALFRGERGEKRRHCEFRVFRGLNGEKAEVQPPFRAVTFHAEPRYEHRGEQKNADGIEDEGIFLYRFGRNEGHGKHCRNAEDERDTLRFDIVEGVAELQFRRIRRRGINEHEPYAGKQHRGKGERLVEREKLSPLHFSFISRLTAASKARPRSA